MLPCIPRRSPRRTFAKSLDGAFPHFLFENLDGGSYTETTLMRNVEDLQGASLRQRVLNDMSHIDTGTELFGRKLRLPVILGPIRMRSCRRNLARVSG